MVLRWDRIYHFKRADSNKDHPTKVFQAFKLLIIHPTGTDTFKIKLNMYDFHKIRKGSI